MNVKSKLKTQKYRFATSSYDNTNIRFEADKLKTVSFKQGRSFNLEVINKGKLGSAYSNQPNVDFLVESALASSSFGEAVKYDYPKKTQDFLKVNLFSPKVKSLTTEELVKRGKKIIETIKEVDKNILVSAHVDKSIGDHVLETSSGVSISEQATTLSIYAEGELVNEGDILNIGEYHSWRDDNFKFKEFTESIKNKFQLSKKIIKASSGEYTVIFSPEVLTTLLEFLETSLSAQAVYKKVSKWTDSLGKQVTDKRFSLIDNPHIDFAKGSVSCDDEGMVTEILPLIESGVLRNFFTDLKNAHRINITPNGRGFGIPTSPGLTNVLVTPGDKPRDKIISETKKGIIIDQVIGGGQDSPYAGDFTFNIHLGFLIENGEIIGRVKDCLVSGNIFDMLKNQIAEISSDTKWEGGALNLPTISFEKVNIVTKVS